MAEDEEPVQARVGEIREHDREDNRPGATDRLECLPKDDEEQERKGAGRASQPRGQRECDGPDAMARDGGSSRCLASTCVVERME